MPEETAVTFSLRKLLTDLVNTGVEGLSNSREKRPVIIINALSLITILLILSIGIFLYTLTQSLFILIPVLVESGCFAGVIYLNKRQKFHHASFATLLLHCIFAVYFGGVLGRIMPIELITAFLLTYLIGASFLIYKRKEIRWFTVLTTSLIFLAFHANSYYNIVDPIYVPEEIEMIMKMACWVGMLILMSFVTFFIIRQNDIAVRENNKLLRALETASEAKSRFLRETSHEIRTPLNAVFGISQLLYARKHQLQDPAVMKEVMEDIDYLYSAAVLSRDIINNVLDLAKIESGKFDEPVIEPVFLKDLFERNILLNKYVGQTRNIRISLQIDPQLPEKIVSDKIFLAKIINNLTSNAVKFATEGTRVSIHVKQEDQRITAMVKNHGSIPAEKAEMIFEPFYAERNKTNNGTGLGLQITRHLATALGGSVSLQRENDHTIFKFSIPLLVANDLPLSPDDTPKPFKNEFAGRKILVIEDDLMARHITMRALVEMGAVPILAEDGETGIALVATESPDLVITDSNLPGIKGITVIQHIRSIPEYRNLPVIVSSGEAFMQEKQDLIKAGADDFLEKPVVLADLQRVLRKYLPGRVLLH